MTRTDLKSLDTTAHRFHRHPANNPAAAGAAATRDTIASLRGAERVPQTELLERARRYEDPYLGPLRSLDEEDLPQVPLALCRATVTDPYGRRPPPAVEPVIGWGPGREEARVRAVLAALAAYGSLVAEHESRQAGARATAWGVDLLTGAMCRVPIHAGDPAAGPHSAVERPAYRAPLGAAAGLCWDEAVEAGLLAHIEALPDLWQDIDARQIDPVRESGGHEDVLGGVRLLERTGEVFGFRDHSATVGLPAYTVTAGHGVVARSVALTPAQALRHAAEHALLSWQARVEGRPEAVPPSRRWAAGGPETGTAPGADVLARRLLDATGRIPVIVPLVRDHVMSSLLPFVIQVVLCGD